MSRLDAITAKLLEHGRDRASGEPPEGPRAAVAAILRELPGAEGADLLFIRRAEHPGDPWSGHVAFPGGRRDPDDVSLLATAIRETREEVGIELSAEHLLARMPDVKAFTKTKYPAMVVSPFVFALRTDPVIVANEDEVGATLWVPLATLARADSRTTFSLVQDNVSYDLPCIILEPGGHRLWGLTYWMLQALLDAVK